MYGLRHVPTGKFLRVHDRNNFVADGTLKDVNLVVFTDLWTLTQFIELNLKGQVIEIVELEMRELRVVPPVIDVKAEEPKPDAPTGDQLSITHRV
jgi:hypothetical protein